MFNDRRDAGIRLARELEEFKDRKDVIILALPRGGVVVAYEIARALHVPLDVFVVRKLGFPGRPELAIGAVSETGAVVLNQDLLSTQPVSKAYLDRELEGEKEEILRRVALYRGGRKLPVLRGKVLILVDDGLATGATARAAIAALKREKPKRLVTAVPMAPTHTALEFERLVDTFICLETDRAFYFISAYYHDFTQVTDTEVSDLLSKASLELQRERKTSEKETVA
jgi:predicted phosphoribosyltransferase